MGPKSHALELTDHIFPDRCPRLGRPIHTQSHSVINIYRVRYQIIVGHISPCLLNTLQERN